VQPSRALSIGRAKCARKFALRCCSSLSPRLLLLPFYFFSFFLLLFFLLLHLKLYFCFSLFFHSTLATHSRRAASSSAQLAGNCCARAAHLLFSFAVSRVKAGVASATAVCCQTVRENYKYACYLYCLYAARYPACTISTLISLPFDLKFARGMSGAPTLAGLCARERAAVISRSRVHRPSRRALIVERRRPASMMRNCNCNRFAFAAQCEAKPSHDKQNARKKASARLTRARTLASTASV
jgi:hypothetical protein